MWLVSIYIGVTIESFVDLNSMFMNTVGLSLTYLGFGIILITFVQLEGQLRCQPRMDALFNQTICSCWSLFIYNLFVALGGLGVSCRTVLNTFK